jgi:hypothetical protein
MKKALAALVVAALLPACGGGKGIADVNDDTVQIMASSAPDADFLALFLNRRTVLFNGDLPVDRLHVIGSRLKLIGCRDPRLVRERAEEQEGTWSFGGKRIVYYSDWRCA